MTTRTILRLLAGAAIVVAGASLYGDGTASIVAVDLLSAVAVGLAWWGAGRQAHVGRAAWSLSALGISLWFAGDLIWDQQVLTTGTVPTVSAADVAYIAGYPAFIAAVVVMIRHRARHHLRDGLIDAAGVGLAAGLAAWVFLVPTLSVDSVGEQLVTLAYPLADVALLAALAWLVLSPGIRGVPSALAAGGMTLTLVVDVARSIGVVADHAVVARWLDNAYPLVYLVLALAACHLRSGELTLPDPAPSDRLQPARVVFMGLTLFSGPTISAFAPEGDHGTHVAVLVITVVIGLMVLVRFVVALGELERSRQAMSVIAGTDSLTGLDNRRRFIESGGRLVGRHGRDGVAALMIDIDHFKTINDTHGHAAGDEVLVELARRANLAVRPLDLLGRLGGDELALLVADGAPDTAGGLAERLRALVAERPFPVPSSTQGRDRTIAVTLSIGVAVGRFASIDEALRHADAALYEAKRRGRDRSWLDVVDAVDTPVG